MQNIIELVIGLCVFHSLISLFESIRDFKPTTTNRQRFYTGRCLNDKGKVIL